MKKQDIVVGSIYTAKVSGGVVPVKIRDERWVGDKHVGWVGVNTATGRAVTIKSAQRLRAAVAAKGPEADGTPDVATGGERAAQVVGAAGSPKPPTPPKGGGKGGATKAKAPKATGSQKGAKAADAKPKVEAKKAPAPKEPRTNGPMSGLDAAAKILVESKKPLNCKELVAEAFKKKYWRSEGATPEATVSAAIGREIRAKGADSRFKKAGRGLFAAAGKGA